MCQKSSFVFNYLPFIAFFKWIHIEIYLWLKGRTLTATLILLCVLNDYKRLFVFLKVKICKWASYDSSAIIFIAGLQANLEFLIFPIKRKKYSSKIKREFNLEKMFNKKFIRNIRKKANKNIILCNISCRLTNLV